MKKCLILMDDTHPSIDLELLEVACRVFADTDVHVTGLQLDPAAAHRPGGFDEIIHFDCGAIEAFDAAGIAEGIAKLHEAYTFDCILVPATPFGRMAAPRIAMRLRSGLVADVVALELIDGELEMQRPAYSGKLMAGIVKQGSGPVMMSIRQGVFPVSTARTADTRMSVFPFVREGSIGIVCTGTREKPRSRDIRDYDVLVSGGGGVLDHFSRLEDLSQALHAQVAASRRLVDSGIASRRIQVGQSGKTVSPRLYIAVGIDGSLQHMEGLKNVEYLIAVNTNKDAPICSLADVVIVGDAVEFIDRLLERIERT